MSTIYLLDSNSLITASRSYYSFQICPGFWDALLKGHSENRIKTIDRVKGEINDGKYNDDLKKWVNDLPNSFFCSTREESVIKRFGEIANWVNNQEQFFDYAKANFMNDKVDGWLIAYVMAGLEGEQIKVVTHEAYSKEIKNEVKIPNICNAFGVEYVNTFEMLNDIEVKLILEDNDE